MYTEKASTFNTRDSFTSLRIFAIAAGTDEIVAARLLLKLLALLALLTKAAGDVLRHPTDSIRIAGCQGGGGCRC